MQRDGGRMTLEAVLETAVAALIELDADALEALAAELTCIKLPGSPWEWRRAASRHWVLGHLVGETGKRLAMLRRVAEPEASFAASFGASRGRAIQIEARSA